MSVPRFLIRVGVILILFLSPMFNQNISVDTRTIVAALGNVCLVMLMLIDTLIEELKGK